MKQRIASRLLRALAALLALVLLLSLAACGKPEAEETDAASGSRTVTGTASGAASDHTPGSSGAAPGTSEPGQTDPAVSGDPGGNPADPDPGTPGITEPDGTAPGTSAEPQTTDAAETVHMLQSVDAEALESALLQVLEGVPEDEEWQLVVIDPLDGTKVSIALHCEADEWMTANYMAPVFLMAAAFQKVEDGDFTENQILNDVKTMIVRSDKAAAGRLVDRIGGDNPLRGRERVRTFVKGLGLELGFNPSESRPDNNRSFVQARYAAEILRMLVNRELVSQEASDKMLEVLLTPRKVRNEIVFNLDEEIRYGFVNDVEDGVCVCTMGVVCLPGRSFVISIVCNRPSQMIACKQRLIDLVSAAVPYFPS